MRNHFEKACAAKFISGTLLFTSFFASPVAWSQKNNVELVIQPGVLNSSPATSSIEDKIVELLASDKIEQAKQAIRNALKGEQTDDAKLYYLLALIEYNEQDFKSAATDLERVRQLVSTNSDHSGVSQTWLLKRLGDCYFNTHDFSKAVSNYQAALTDTKHPVHSQSLLIKLNEQIMSSLVAENEYKDALPYAERLLQLTKARAASGKLADLGDLVWAYLENMDLLRRMGSEKDTERLKLRNECAPLIHKLIAMRHELEQKGQLPSLEELGKTQLQAIENENRPATVAEDLWLSNDFKVRSLPLIGWFPQGNPGAALLCIHGLGLENRAFTKFGLAMAKRGYAVYAIDVRGFGAWLNIPAEESVQFDYAVADIGGMINAIKYMNRKVPLFLVGESMGGGLALQAGARFGDQLSGLIASVPSPDRYEERRSTVKVAVRYIKGRNKGFDITNMVAKKAVSDPKALESWTNDAKAKMNMTPNELLHFDEFMKDTKSACKSIKSTPVFIVQGLKDRLVKPEGTQELFDAITNDDKALLLLGDKEHLIFENDSPDPTILDTLASWMSHHNSVAP